MVYYEDDKLIIRDMESADTFRMAQECGIKTSNAFNMKQSVPLMI